MRKFTTLLAALGAAFAVGNANALVILVDDFDAPYALVADATGADGAAHLGAVQNLGYAPTKLASTRQLSHQVLTSGVIGNTGNLSSVSVGGLPNFPVGSLQMANASGVDSEVKVSWTLAPVALSGPVSFAFKVIESNQGTPTTLNTLDFTLNGSLLANVTLGNVSNTDFFFSLNAAQVASLAGGGSLVMTVNGTPGWDLTLDSFGLQVPEPTSLALVGLALVGAGVVSRRSRSA
jgi:PEP-CTERM motif